MIYPVPTWNNNHYAYLSGARGVPVIVSAASNFFPTPDQLREHLSTARLLVLNSPLNPTGTVISKDALTAITTMVVEENRRREATRGKPLYFVFDHVYWMLTFGKATHHTPVALVPESAPYVIFLDAISKAFCATGMRVGWGVMPPAVRRRMSDILGHVGAWAPKAEQVGVAALLNQPEAISAYRDSVRGKLVQRLEALYRGVMDLRNDGFPVDAIEPQGAIYLSARFDLFGRTVNGTAVKTNDDVRRLLLGAGIGVVPFQAFGLAGDTGWFRLSAGAVSMDDIAAAFPRLRALLAAATDARVRCALTPRRYTSQGGAGQEVREEPSGHPRGRAESLLEPGLPGHEHPRDCTVRRRLDGKRVPPLSRQGDDLPDGSRTVLEGDREPRLPVQPRARVGHVSRQPRGAGLRRPRQRAPVPQVRRAHLRRRRRALGQPHPQVLLGDGLPLRALRRGAGRRGLHAQSPAGRPAHDGRHAREPHLPPVLRRRDRVRRAERVRQGHGHRREGDRGHPAPRDGCATRRASAALRRKRRSGNYGAEPSGSASPSTRKSASPVARRGRAARGRRRGPSPRSPRNARAE